MNGDISQFQKARERAEKGRERKRPKETVENDGEDRRQAVKIASEGEEKMIEHILASSVIAGGISALILMLLALLAFFLKEM